MLEFRFSPDIYWVIPTRVFSASRNILPSLKVISTLDLLLVRTKSPTITGSSILASLAALPGLVISTLPARFVILPTGAAIANHGISSNMANNITTQCFVFINACLLALFLSKKDVILQASSELKFQTNSVQITCIFINRDIGV